LLPEITQAITDRQAGNGDPSSALTSSTGANETTPSLIVPLTVRDEVIGVLGLQETDEQRIWLPEEIALIEAISEQLAQAAENIRLIDESQQRAAREKRVNEIGEKIQAAQSLEEALQIAVKEVGLSLQSPQTIVKLEVK
jgi:GAF domain-containing protein